MRKLEVDSKILHCIIKLSDDRIASCCDDNKRIKVWSINTGECLKDIKVHSSKIQWLAKLSNSLIITCEQDKKSKY